MSSDPTVSSRLRSDVPRIQPRRLVTTVLTGLLLMVSGLAWSSPASAAAASWTSIGGTGNGWGSGNVLSLVAVDATHVYGGGYGGTNFTTNSLGFLKFNGTSWSATAGGPARIVNAIARTDDDTFYVGGDGGVTGNIRKWDGTTWSALAGGTDGDVNAIAVDASGKVYVGGIFNNVNDGSNNVSGTARIAMWDPTTSTWSALGRGVSTSGGSNVYALAVDSAGALYVGGQFANVVDGSGNAVPNTANIAKWNGSNWSAVGAGTAGTVDALAADSSGNVYAGGSFASVSNSGGAVSNTSAIAKWNGATWAAMGSGFNTNTFNVTKLTVSPTSGRVYAVSNLSGITRVWAGGAWSSLPDIGGQNWSVAVDSAEKLYVGGQFSGKIQRLDMADVPLITGLSPTTGTPSGGTSVSITGTGFDPSGTSFTFDGTPCLNVVVSSSSSATCDAPAGAVGTVDVAVTVSPTTTTRSQAFTYAPAPDLTSINPASGSSAGGTSVTLSGTGLTGATAVTFGGTNATTFTVVDDSTITATTPSKSPGAYDVAVVTPSGDDSLASAFTFTAAPTPDPVFPPSAPRDVTAVGGDRSAVVSWQQPSSSGSFPVSTYKATSSPEGKTCLAAAPILTCTVAGLTNGAPYTFTVEALNGAGWGPAGGPSSPVTPGGVTPAPAPVPLPAPLSQGQSNLQTNGVVDPNVTVDPNNRENGLVITGDGWSMDLDGLGPDGKPLNLSPSGALRLANERDVQTEGTGFLPNSEVDLYVDPPVLLTGQRARASEDGIYVGTVRTDARGNFTGTATLPDDIDPGDHVLQAVGYSPERQSRAMSLGVIVERWIVLDKGTRQPDGRHDRIRTTGTTGGIDPGEKLRPWIRYGGQSAFTPGKASITVQADGSFRWSREIRKDKTWTAYVSYLDTESNRIVWARIR